MTITELQTINDFLCKMLFEEHKSLTRFEKIHIDQIISLTKRLIKEKLNEETKS